VCASPADNLDRNAVTALAPEWLTEALAATPTTSEVQVEGAAVRYRSWGSGSEPAVVLIHGGLAHARWWDHVGPLLPGRIIALDLTGHGDSEHRERYDTNQWAREIIAVTDHASLTQPLLVGHSMGGLPAVTAAIMLGNRARGVVTIDVRFNDDPWPARFKESNRYASVDDAVLDFVPVHTHPSIAVEPYLLRHVAEQSLVYDRDAWRWKRADGYDITRTALRELLPQLHSPVVLLRSDHGLLSSEAADEMLSMTPGPGLHLAVPAAGHNPMLEQPLAFIGIMRSLLAWWPPNTQQSGSPTERHARPLPSITTT
jgi:pimeloyl-ACP methyl ester carboxylesterase